MDDKSLGAFCWELQMKFSENLKKAMLEHKISQKKLSTKVGLPVSTLHGWLNGAAPKNIQDLKKVASIFGLTIDQLCFDDIKQTQPENSLVREEKVVAHFGTVELVLRLKE
jgi:transcriptional regulator with XRE-family HTH domain